MVHANPGLRPGLSSAVPAGLVIVGSHADSSAPEVHLSHRLCRTQPRRLGVLPRAEPYLPIARSFVRARIRPCVRRAMRDHQNALASTLGLPCIPFTTCELRTTSKLV